jgi:hypothetical protein
MSSTTLIVTSRTYRPTLPEKTRAEICNLINNKPGLKSREIAGLVCVDQRELNRFLWYEGKVSRGLYVRNWRWYHSGTVQPPIPGPLPGTSNSAIAAPRTVCGVLSGMDELTAIRQIRRMDLLAVEKAHSEDDYSGLPDVLKIELVQRLEQLKAEAPLDQRSSASFHPLLSFGLMVVGIAILVKVLEMLSK